MVFLDWEKAFDKVDQAELIKAIRRLNVPEKICRILETFYINPQFAIRDSEGKSGYRKQRTGIRQGCPLSPYLFVLLMTVMFNDIHNELDSKIIAGKLDHFRYHEILYADDTLIIGKRAREVNMIIKAIEKESAKYNMKLNKGKCNHIDMNCKADVKFEGGAKLDKLDKAVYLGGTITEKALKTAEIQTRLGKAMTTAFRLKEFWKGCNAPRKWKLQVYNAIIISQLIYGLNTIHLTNSCLKTLDTFQLRGLRQILGIKAAFHSRISHDKVMEKANIIMNNGEDLDINWEQFKTEKPEQKKE